METVESPFVWLIKQVPKGYEADEYRLMGPAVSIDEGGDVGLILHDHIATVTHMHQGGMKEGEYVVNFCGYAEDLGTYVLKARLQVPEAKRKIENMYIRYVRKQRNEFNNLCKLLPKQLDKRSEQRREERRKKEEENS